MDSGIRSMVSEACPYLVPCNANGTEYEGYLPVLEDEFHIQVILPAPDDIKNIRVKGSWKLRQLLVKCQTAVEQRLKQCSTLSDFVLELQALLENELRSSKTEFKDVLCKPVYYETLLSQLELCGWEQVSYLSSDLSEINFEISDDSNRLHMLKVLLPKQFPVLSPSFVTDLPVNFAPKWSKTNALLEILSNFKKQVEQLQLFWNVMDGIDCELWVLEPEKPMRKDTVRRIAIKGTTSMQIRVDPINPNAIPECLFFGPDSSISSLQESFNKNTAFWDENKSVVENLESVLQIQFPSAMNSKKADFSVECGICYSYLIQDCFPDVTCKGPNCGQLFHQLCLYEWLRALPNTGQSFNTLFGDCPYCNTHIVCKLP